VAARSLIPRLTDIIEAIERIHAVMGDIPLDVFEADWQRQWLVERGVEIISEASRHLTDELKARHPEIPWEKVAGRFWKKSAERNWQRSLSAISAADAVVFLSSRLGARAHTYLAKASSSRAIGKNLLAHLRKANSQS